MPLFSNLPVTVTTLFVTVTERLPFPPSFYPLIFLASADASFVQYRYRATTSNDSATSKNFFAVVSSYISLLAGILQAHIRDVPMFISYAGKC